MVKSMSLGLLLCLISLPGLAAQWNGVVDWSQRTELGTTVSGVVASLPVKAGERVKKGQLEIGGPDTCIAPKAVRCKCTPLEIHSSTNSV